MAAAGFPAIGTLGHDLRGWLDPGDTAVPWVVGSLLVGLTAGHLVRRRLGGSRSGG